MLYDLGSKIKIKTYDDFITALNIDTSLSDFSETETFEDLEEMVCNYLSNCETLYVSNVIDKTIFVYELF